MDWEGSDRVLTDVLCRPCLVELRKITKISGWVAGNPAENRTKRVPHTTPERYRQARRSGHPQSHIISSYYGGTTDGFRTDDRIY
jgi:hypothetical protein